MHREMLNQLHEAHQGMVRKKQRACLIIYWPGLDNDIDNMVSQSTQCQTHLPSHPKESLISKPRPARPFQETAADVCYHAGRNYLVFVDCFTDWPTVVPMGKCATSTNLITAARELFGRTAVPDVFCSDGGPQFTSHQFQDFSTHWGFRHQVSSPHYPQSNGKAEATVKAMKKSFVQHGMGDSWTRTNCARACYSIAIFHQQEMGYHQIRNFSGIPCRIHYQPIPGHFPMSGSIVQKK